MSERLIDAPVGLFLYDGCMVLKTEYNTITDGKITPDCYIVSSGEYFWGGVETIEERNALEVTPVEAKTVVQGQWLHANDPDKKRCSRCDVIHMIAQYPRGEIDWCPNCGAKMDGKEQGDDNT